MRKSDFMRWGRLFITAIIVGSFSAPPQTLAAEKKLTKKQKAANSRWLSPAPSPVPFMKFDELAKLEHTQRLKYVRALRQSAREIEKMQFMFRDSRKKNASLERQNWQRLYAFLISEPAEAQTEPVGDTGNRGRKDGDRCIYGYNLSNYPTDGKRQPFLCKIPPEALCSQNGVRCGNFLSGLGAHPGGTCISEQSKHIATQICDAKRTELSGKNSKDINDAFENAKKFFTLNGENPVITKEEMVNGEATQILQELAKHAYDDRIYAMLIYVLGLYKKNLVTPPVRGDITDTVYAKLLNPDYFEKNLDNVQTAINQVFTDYLSHCNSDVPDGEIDALTDPNWMNKYRAGEKDTVHGLEAERIQAALKYKNQGGSKKVQDITEIPECRAIRARIAGITNNMNTIRGSYPIPTGPGPTPPTDGNKPPEQIIAEPNPKPAGCTANVTNDGDLLAQSAARCIKCLADKAVSQTANSKQLSAQENTQRESYGSSTKWLSLLSTMALACGEGFDGQQVSVEVMDKYRLLFGHCSVNTYKWDEGEVLSQKDRGLIQEWASAEKWSGEGGPWKTNTADIDNDFARIYGITYENATQAFCNPKRFDKGFFSGKIKKLKSPKEIAKMSDKEKKDLEARDSVSSRREQFLTFLNDGKKTKSISGDLLGCLNESAKTAETYYSQNSAACMSSQKIDGSQKKNMETMITHIKSGGASILYDKGNCMVSAQIEKHPTNPDLENIGFIQPDAVIETPNMYPLFYDTKRGNMPAHVFPDNQIVKHNSSGKYQLCSATNSDRCELLNNYSFLYPNPGLCAVASKNKYQGDKQGESN